MNDNMQRRLEEARTELLNAQFHLRMLRLDQCETAMARAVVCYAIDRAWEAQCMAQGSL